MCMVARLLLLTVALSTTVAAHGANWSKLYLSRTGNRLSIQLHISDESIARISSVNHREMPVADLLENDRSFIISEIWKGIGFRVDGANPGEMVDGGFRIAEKEQHPAASGEFHSHGTAVQFSRTWSIPDSAKQVVIAIHLFSAEGVPMKWLVLAGAQGNRKTLIVSPGGSITFNFVKNSFVENARTTNRFLPLWIALAISSTIVFCTFGVYFSVVRKRKKTFRGKV